MRFCGVRVADDGSFPIALLKQMGANLLSITPRPWWDARMVEYLTDARQNGLAVLLCIDSAALGEPIADIGQKYGHLATHANVVNEADDRGRESSYTAPNELTEILWSFRNAFGPNVYLIAGGFSTGQPSYLDDVDLSPCNAVGVHPYGQRPDNVNDWSWVPGNFGFVGDLLRSYGALGYPLWVDEVGIGSVNDRRQADYCLAMLAALDHLGIDGAAWFCGRDFDGRRYGVLDANGNRKPSFSAFQDVARLILGGQPQPVPEPEPAQPWIGDGLLRGLQATGWTPVPGTGEVAWPVVRCQGDAVLLWDPEKGRVYRVPNLGRKVVA